MRITRQSCSFILILFVQLSFLWSAPIVSASDDQQLDSLISLLNSGNWQSRMMAAREIGSIPIDDTSRAMGILIRAIESEFENPVSLDVSLIGSDMSDSELLRREYTSTLIKISPFPSAFLRAFVDTAKGEMRDWVLTALAIQGDKSVHDDVRIIASTSPSPWIRLRAFEGLRAYRDSSDVDLFEKALSDTFRTEALTDIYLEDGSRGVNPAYPIRSQAMMALRDLGFEVIPDTANGGYKAVKIEK